MLEEYRVQIKVRNNLILEKIEEMGFKSLKSFCEKAEINYSQTAEIVNLKLSPLNCDSRKEQKFKNLVYKLCNYLGCDPEELFTETMINNEVVTNTKIIKIHENDLRMMLESDSFTQLGNDEIYLQNKLPNDVNNLLANLSETEQKVIKMRFGLSPYIQEHTYKEIAKEIGRSVERARQYEVRALRKLRNPSRAKAIVPHLNHETSLYYNLL